MAWQTDDERFWAQANASSPFAAVYFDEQELRCFWLHWANVDLHRDWCREQRKLMKRK